MTYLKIIGFIMFCAGLSSCFQQPNYDPEPIIDFRHVEVKDTIDELGNIVKLNAIAFKIIDGDGNFGIDTLADYYTDSSLMVNFYCKMFYVKNGNIYEYELPGKGNFNGKIPYVPPIGLNDYYKATIIYDVKDPLNIQYPIRFEFYVIDNAFNESNVQVTPWIAPDFRGIMADTNNLIID